MTTTMKTSPFSLLLNRKSEKLSQGAFQPHVSIEEEDRTSYSFARIDVAAHGDLARVPSPLGLGYLQAVLTVLRMPPHMSYDMLGLVGRMEPWGAEKYSFSWNENEGTECRQGGFVYEGKPNYYSAMLGLIQCIAMYLSGERLQSQEVVTAWCKLLTLMEATFPRTSNIWGWKDEAISDACLHDETRHAILRVCDCLRAAMQYQLAVKHRRQVFVYEYPVIGPDEGIAIEVEGHKFLDPAWIEMTAALATPLPVPHPATTTPSSKPSGTSGTPISPTSTGFPPPATTRPTPTRPLGGSPAPSSTSPSLTTSHATPTASRSSSDLYGPYLDQVRMGLAQGGSLLLVGPTGTGKSSLLLDAAISLGWGVELIVCHEGKRIHILQGGHTRDVEKGDGDWRFAAGPITRLARRIEAGERVMLILDELARAHKEVFAYVMDLLNSYSSREIQAMIPKQEGDGMKLETPG